MQDFGNHFHGRKMSPGESKHSEWLPLRPVSPARVAVYVQNFYLYLKVSPLCLFCQKRKVWFSQNSLICPLAFYFIQKCFVSIIRKKPESLRGNKYTEPPSQIKGIRVSESKEKTTKPSCKPRVFSGHSRSTLKWVYKWREKSKV